MAKIIAICGKICAGKTYYAQSLKDKENAVILSCDELTNDLFDNNLGDSHDEMSERIRAYFYKKSAELVRIGCNVILDWGFWKRADRDNLRNFCKSNGFSCEWHYVKVNDKTWLKNIDERNNRIINGDGGSDYYLDDGLMIKLQSLWEEPDEKEIDILYTR